MRPPGARRARLGALASFRLRAALGLWRAAAPHAPELFLHLMGPWIQSPPSQSKR